MALYRPPRQVHVELSVNPSQRVICIGDVHGCFDELCRLLELVKWQEEVDIVILVGDLVNKGPKSLEVLRFMQSKRGVYAVRGNHDESCLNSWFNLKVNGTACRHSWVNQLSEADVEYLLDLPYSMTLGANFIVHAGLDPLKSLEDQDCETMVTLRAWASDYKGQHGHVIFGHDAKRGLQFYDHATGLDSGCVYGRSLTAIVLPTREIHSVPAAAIYEAPKTSI